MTATTTDGARLDYLVKEAVEEHVRLIQKGLNQRKQRHGVQASEKRGDSPDVFGRLSRRSTVSGIANSQGFRKGVK